MITSKPTTTMASHAREMARSRVSRLIVRSSRSQIRSSLDLDQRLTEERRPLHSG
jgi:hypothetical protein